MSKHSRPENDRRRTRTLVAASFGVGALALTGSGVFASITAEATNATPKSVDSGTLKLEMTATGAALSTAITNMAPGDVENRFVALTNSGTLDGKNLGFAVTTGAANALNNSTTKGLSVSVSRCTGPYIATTGFCSAAVATPAVAGIETTMVSKTSVVSLGSRTAFGGPIDPAAGATYNLKLSVHLDGTETVTNGVLPAGTMQGLSTTLTYTFSEDQRTATTTNA
jgi:hypothetical protein